MRKLFLIVVIISLFTACGGDPHTHTWTNGWCAEDGTNEKTGEAWDSKGFDKDGDHIRNMDTGINGTEGTYRIWDWKGFDKDGGIHIESPEYKDWYEGLSNPKDKAKAADPHEINYDDYDEEGYHKITGFHHTTHIWKGNGTLYNEDGYDYLGFNENGFDENGNHKKTGNVWDENGFREDGTYYRNNEGYDYQGFNADGFNASGYNKFTEANWDWDGKDKDGSLVKTDTKDYDDWYKQNIAAHPEIPKSTYEEQVIINDEGFYTNGLDAGKHSETGELWDWHGKDIYGYEVDPHTAAEAEFFKKELATSSQAAVEIAMTETKANLTQQNTDIDTRFEDYCIAKGTLSLWGGSVRPDSECGDILVRHGLEYISMHIVEIERQLQENGKGNKFMTLMNTFRTQAYVDHRVQEQDDTLADSKNELNELYSQLNMSPDSIIGYFYENAVPYLAENLGTHPNYIRSLLNQIKNIEEFYGLVDDAVFVELAPVTQDYPSSSIDDYKHVLPGRSNALINYYLDKARENNQIQQGPDLGK